MGLDLLPLGKPAPGHEARFAELYGILTGTLPPWPIGTPRDQFIAEFQAVQRSHYETIGAPRTGRDLAADQWVRRRYEDTDQRQTFEAFAKTYDDFYVAELARERDGLSYYLAAVGDQTGFRGKFLEGCGAILPEELINQAWVTQLAPDALAYARDLYEHADAKAAELGLGHLRDQREPPEFEPGDEDSPADALHVVFSLARWMRFYAERGHGYEADY